MTSRVAVQHIFISQGRGNGLSRGVRSERSEGLSSVTCRAKGLQGLPLESVCFWSAVVHRDLLVSADGFVAAKSCCFSQVDTFVTCLYSLRVR